jgi:hypothetical protein
VKRRLSSLVALVLLVSGIVLLVSRHVNAAMLPIAIGSSINMVIMTVDSRRNVLARQDRARVMSLAKIAYAAVAAVIAACCGAVLWMYPATRTPLDYVAFVVWVFGLASVGALFVFMKYEKSSA